MANAFGYTPCKDEKYETCSNYLVRCTECTRKNGYTILLAGSYKDYYIRKR